MNSSKIMTDGNFSTLNLIKKYNAVKIKILNQAIDIFESNSDET